MVMKTISLTQGGSRNSSDEDCQCNTYAHDGSRNCSDEHNQYSTIWQQEL